MFGVLIYALALNILNSMALVRGKISCVGNNHTYKRVNEFDTGFISTSKFLTREYWLASDGISKGGIKYLPFSPIPLLTNAQCKPQSYSSAV